MLCYFVFIFIQSSFSYHVLPGSRKSSLQNKQWGGGATVNELKQTEIVITNQISGWRRQGQRAGVELNVCSRPLIGHSLDFA